MNYIDKTTNADAANEIVTDFLEETRRRGNNPGYKLFALTPLKDQLRDLLIAEQQGYCCYCMRKLAKDETTTLEHVIPRGSDEAECNGYLTRYAKYFSNIVHLDAFVRTWSYPPYPHSVSYYNLMASCNGLLTEGSRDCSCCNNKRGHDEIIPLPFISTINGLIKYTSSGRVYATDGDIQKDDAIRVLSLNTGTLKEIRKLWHSAKEKGVDVTTKAELLSVFDNDILKMSKDFLKYYQNEYYFNLFQSYKWFYGYYA